MFGKRQKNIYKEIIETAVDMIAADPEKGGSRSRDDLAQRVRSFHLELAAGRLGGASHCLYYTKETLENATAHVVVLRILHEHMEPTLHFAP